MKKNRSNSQFELDSSLKVIAKASFFVFFGLIFAKLLTYFYRIAIARHFGPEIYGLFSLSIIIFVWVVSFFSLGLFEGILRYVAFYRGQKDYNKIRYTFKFFTKFLVFSSILAAFLLFLFSGFISNTIFHNTNLIPFLKIISIAVPFFTIAYVFLSIMQAFERIKAHSLVADFSLNFIKFIALLLLVFIGMGANAVILSYLMAVFGIFLFSYFYSRYKLSTIFEKHNLNEKTKKEIKKEIFSYSFPLILLGILYSFLYNIDSFVIGAVLNMEAVGIYNAAVPIALLIAFSPLLFIRIFFPMITREFSRKKMDLIGKLSQQIEKWIILFNLPLFLLVFIFPGVFINLFFGQEYLDATNALRFLSIGMLFYSLAPIFHSLLLMIGKSRVILYNVIFISFFNLILNIILVPIYGISGAAFATMISYILLSIIFFLQVKHYLKIVPLKLQMFRIILSLVPPTLLLIFFRQFMPLGIISILLQGTFFGLLYILLIFLTNTLDRNDLMILRGIKQKFLNLKYLKKS